MAKPDGDGFPSLAEALDLALAEEGEGTPSDSEAADPAADETLLETDEQAEVETEEQPEAEGETEAPSADDAEEVEEDDEEDSLFGDLLEEDEAAPDEQPVDLDSMTFELPNGEQVEGVQALKDGYMRHADYTQKTQQLADQRKALEAENTEAKRVYEALRSNPLGFFSSLAKQVGVDVDVQGAKNPNFEFGNQESFESEVEKRVQERIETDPEIQEARQAAAKVRVDNEFARIEQEREVTLKPKDRKTVLDFALKNDIVNLDVAFDALMARKSTKQQQAAERTERAKKTSTKRSAGRVPEKDVTRPPQSVAEAAQRAAAEIAAS